MKLDEVKKGGTDQRGRQILDVYWSTKDYVIFRHPAGISPHFSDEPERADKQRTAYGEIGLLLSKVNALRSTVTVQTDSIDREIARAVAQALDGHQDNAKAILAEIRTRLQGLRSAKGRLQYQISAFATMALLALGVWAVHLLLSTSFSDGVLMVLRVTVCGALGGFLSVSMTIKSLDIDPDSNWKLNALAGSSRIVIAVIGSIFIYFVIKSKLVLGNVELLATPEGSYAIAIAAGFSENFVPNILGKITRAEEKPPAEKPPQG